MLKLKQYKLSWVARTPSQLEGKVYNVNGELALPENACIHYLTDTPTDYGIRKSHILLQGTERPLRVSHVAKLIGDVGNPKVRAFNVDKVVRGYIKSRGRSFHKVQDLARAIRDKKSVLVMDYSLLPHMYRYPATKVRELNEYHNHDTTLYSTIKDVGDTRVHFVTLRVPNVLPTLSRLKTLTTINESAALDELRDKDVFDLVQLFTMLTTESRQLSRELEQQVIYVFHTETMYAQVTMHDLFEWYEDKGDALLQSLYKLLNKLAQSRTVTTIDVDVTDEDEVGHAEVGDVTEPLYEGEDTVKSTVTELLKAGKLTAAQATRFTKMAGEYKNIKAPDGSDKTLEEYLDVPVDQMVMDSSLDVVGDKLFLLDPSMRKSTIDVLDKVYTDQYLEADIANVVVSMQNAGILVRGYTRTERTDAMSNLVDYTVKVQPIDGAESTIHFTLPKLNEDGVFKVSGVNYRLDPQRVDMPIRKAGPNKVALTSYAGKAFVNRHQNANVNLHRWIVGKISNEALASENKQVTKLTLNSGQLTQNKAPRMYTAISEGIRSFTSKGVDFDFQFDNREAVFGKIDVAEKGGQVVCGKRTKDGTLITMDDNGYLYAGDTHLGYTPTFINDAWTKPPVEYAVLRTYGKSPPIGVVLAYRHGLRKLLKLTKAKFRWVDTGGRLDLEEYEFRIRFKDASLVIDGRDAQTRLILAGFQGIRKTTEVFNAREFDKPGIYGTALEDIGIGRHILREVTLMYDMFVDPITKGLLKTMGEPETFEGLIFRSAELLVDDQWVDEMDTNYMRSRGYERFAGFVYKQLVDAIREQKGTPVRSTAKVSIAHRAVLGDIVSDESVVLVEESNPVHALKEREAITFSGQGGRSSRTMVQRSRVFHKNDVGFISESGPDSAKVGIRAHRTPNAKYNSMRGTTDRWVDGVDGGASAFSTPALISPNSTHNDPKRITMGDILWSATVSSVGGEVLPLRTGYDMVIANRVGTDFAVSALDNGVVSDVGSDFIEVMYSSNVNFIPKDTYSDGDLKVDCNLIRREYFGKVPGRMKVDDISDLKPKATYKVTHLDALILRRTSSGYDILSGGGVLIDARKAGDVTVPVIIASEALLTRINKKGPTKLNDLYTKDEQKGRLVGYELGLTHGKAAGAVIPHTKITDHKKGDKFNGGDILAWNSNYFARDYINPGGVTLKLGVLARTLLTETTETYEDSSAVSDKMAAKLATPTSKQKTIMVRFDQVVHNLVKVGDAVHSSTILCALEDTATADIIGEEEGLSGLTRLAANTPKAKFNGVVSRIEVIYMGEVKDMSKSLATIAKADSSIRKRRREILKDDTVAPTAQIKESAFFGGQRVTNNTMAIVLTMDVDNVVAGGDKIAFDTALKSIVAEVMEGGDTTEDGLPIEARTSYRGIAARTVLSPELSGPTNTALVRLGELLADLYFEG